MAYGRCNDFIQLRKRQTFYINLSQGGSQINSASIINSTYFIEVAVTKNGDADLISNSNDVLIWRFKSSSICKSREPFFIEHFRYIPSRTTCDWRCFRNGSGNLRLTILTGGSDCWDCGRYCFFGKDIHRLFKAIYSLFKDFQFRIKNALSSGYFNHLRFT